MAEPLLESTHGACAVDAPLARRSDSDGLAEERRQPTQGDQPRWLRDALAKRNLRPHDGWPPAHHLLTERDLPSEPEEDEKVSVSTTHDELVYELRPGLTSRYRAHSDVLLAFDLYVYFDDIGAGQTNRGTARRMAPDVFVSFGVPKRPRGSYAVWEEGKPPDFALEILSDSTWRKDAQANPALYEQMGVREYFLFDPHEHIEPRLQAWRFAMGERRRLPPPREVASGLRGIYSEVLGLFLCHTEPWRLPGDGDPAAGRLRWHDPATGQWLATATETERRADDLQRRADDLQRRADDLQHRTEAEAKARRAAEHRAADEARARQALEARVASLEAQLRRGRG